MKQCPQCNRTYSDETLLFCLEDGARLTPISNEEPPLTFSPADTGQPTFKNKVTDKISPETGFAGSWTKPPETLGSQSQPERRFAENNLNFAEQTDADLTTEKLLTFAPIVLALAHNYWQWLYLANSRAYGYFEYFVSVNFIVWLVLLIGGVVISILAYRKAREKSFAVTALVILAINFLLCIVPRRF